MELTMLNTESQQPSGVTFLLQGLSPLAAQSNRQGVRNPQRGRSHQTMTLGAWQRLPIPSFPLASPGPWFQDMSKVNHQVLLGFLILELQALLHARTPMCVCLYDSVVFQAFIQNGICVSTCV